MASRTPLEPTVGGGGPREPEPQPQAVFQRRPQRAGSGQLVPPDAVGGSLGPCGSELARLHRVSWTASGKGLVGKACVGLIAGSACCTQRLTSVSVPRGRGPLASGLQCVPALRSDVVSSGIRTYSGSAPPH